MGSIKVQDVKNMGKLIKGIAFSSYIISLLLFSSTIGCSTMKNGKYDIIRNISFSPDCKKLIFDRRTENYPYMLQVYDLESGELRAYRPPCGENWSQVRYSFDGKHLVLIIEPIDGGKVDLSLLQIAVMDPDGNNIRKITHSKGFKVFPSFSHSGKKIIFARADKIRDSGRTPASDYDVYEVDVETGQENRLTQFSFYQMSSPYYFPDDKKFIFWAEYPFSYTGTNTRSLSYEVEKMCKYREIDYNRNEIYVMQGNESTLKPFIIFSDFSSCPLLSADGSIIIFLGKGYTPDGAHEGFQFYRYSANLNHHQITHINARRIWSEALSHNGEFLAAVYEPTESSEINKIVICHIKDGVSKMITLPDYPSNFINNP